MRQATALFALLFVTAALALGSPLSARPALAQEAAPGTIDTIVVQFAADATLADVGDALETSETLPAEATTLPGAAVVVPELGQSADDAIAVLEASENVIYAEPDYPVTATITPNDNYVINNCQVLGGPLLSPCQWGPASMSAPAAWDTTTGSASVVVAVIDTGVQTNHPDLTGKLVAGYNTVGPTHSTNVNDDNGHGTHVSGTIAATTNNSVGVAGICWLCKVMPVKALDASGGGSSTDIAEAINWAVVNGADVINMSLGINLPLCPTSTPIETAVDNAWANGVIVVAASGNNADNADPTDDCVFSPASHPNAIAVGAVDHTGTRASFSNYGPELDVTAPGDYIMSTVMGSGYGLYSGTSMATPHAAGVVGLMISNGVTDKATIVNQITSTATDAGAAGPDDYYGHGRVNAALAIATSDTTPPTLSITAPANGATVAGTIDITANASDASGIQKVRFWVDATYLSFDLTAPYAKSWDTTAFSNGSHTIKAEAVDNNGNTTIATITVTVANSDSTPPVVSITSPANGANVSGTLDITASASDASGIQKVRFWVDATYLSFDLSAPYSKTWDTSSFANGAHTIKAEAVDNYGNATITTISVTVANSDSTPPAVSITSPGNGASVAGTLDITANASDASGIQKVRFWVDATYLSFDLTAPYSKSWNTTTFSNGAHTIKVEAVDNNGNSTITTISVTVANSDSTPPTISITSPSDGGILAGIVTITAAASDAGGVQKVRFWVDSTYLSFDLTAPYSKTWDTTTFSNGEHTLKAEAVDFSGNTSLVTITVTVSN